MRENPFLKRRPFYRSVSKRLMPVLLLSAAAGAAVYYVNNADPAANDANPGTIDLPLLTINQASKKASQPGDIVYVRRGLYDERVVCNYSGNAANGFITFAGCHGDPKPVTRGFTMSDKRYIRIIGFEITHNNLAWNHGITPGGVCDHLEFLDNYIHDIQGHAIRWYNHDISYCTVRGNDIYMAGCPFGVTGECKGNGWAVQMAKGHHNIVEYNHAGRVGDFINVHTDHTIVRNNYLHDFRDSYWPDGLGSGLHCDMFQPCGSTISESQYQVYESNFMGENVETNSHILQMRRTQGDLDHHIIFRGNVGYDFGSYAMQCGGIDYVSFYNNTIHDINKFVPNNPAVGYNSEGENPSLYNHNFNNIFSTTGNAAPVSVRTGCACASSDNVCFKTGPHASCESTADPLFVDVSLRDFHLQAGSPAVNIGKPITAVSGASGSGSVFTVETAGFFCDGFGMAEGDLISVGSSGPVSITGIDGASITVNRSIQWNTGDGVYWRNQDSLPDAGAYEYRAGGYDFSIALDNPHDGQPVSGQTTITTTAHNPDCIRYVMFYIDGIPLAKDIESPYSCVWDASALASGTKHSVECRAYALYASKKLTSSDTVEVLIASTALAPSADASKTVVSAFRSSRSGKYILRFVCLRGNPPIEGTLKLYTVSGSLLKKVRAASGEFSLDAQTVAPGMYCIELSVSGTSRLYRAIVLR